MKYYVTLYQPYFDQAINGAFYGDDDETSLSKSLDNAGIEYKIGADFQTFNKDSTVDELFSKKYVILIEDEFLSYIKVIHGDKIKIVKCHGLLSVNNWCRRQLDSIYKFFKNDFPSWISKPESKS